MTKAAQPIILMLLVVLAWVLWKEMNARIFLNKLSSIVGYCLSRSFSSMIGLPCVNDKLLSKFERIWDKVKQLLVVLSFA